MYYYNYYAFAAGSEFSQKLASFPPPSLRSQRNVTNCSTLTFRLNNYNDPSSSCDYSGAPADGFPDDHSSTHDEGGRDGAQRGPSLHCDRLPAAYHLLGAGYAAYRHVESTIHGPGFR